MALLDLYRIFDAILKDLDVASGTRQYRSQFPSRSVENIVAKTRLNLQCLMMIYTNYAISSQIIYFSPPWTLLTVSEVSDRVLDLVSCLFNVCLISFSDTFTDDLGPFIL